MCGRVTFHDRSIRMCQYSLEINGEVGVGGRVCDIRSPKYTPVLAAVMLLVQRELALLEDN